MHQSTTLSLSQSIWPRWASRQFLNLPTVQTLLPVTLGYSLNSEADVMRRLRRWNRLWQRSLTQEDFHGAFQEFVGTVQVHCSRRRLLRRGLEFHVYTINKSAHTKKVWKLTVCSSYDKHLTIKGYLIRKIFIVLNSLKCRTISQYISFIKLNDNKNG